MGLEGLDSIYLRIGSCEHGNKNLGSKICGKFLISWEEEEELYSVAVVIFWHGYVLRKEGTHCILLIALCKSRLTPAHCISLIVYLTPYILHLTSYTLRLTPYVLRLTPYILHLTSYILHLTSYVLRLTSYILHLTPYILHLTSYILHLTSYILYLISYCIVFCTVWHVYVLCVRHIHDPMLLP
jgi:hypothetical protein